MEELQRQIKEQRRVKAMAMVAKKSNELDTSRAVISDRKVFVYKYIYVFVKCKIF